MKKIFFYALCLQLMAGTGCNNNDEKKSSGSDSTKTTDKPDTGITKAKLTQAIVDPNLTMEHLKIYPLFVGKTEKVKFDSTDLWDFIAANNAKYHVQATEIYFTYGAYTDNDANEYILTHPPMDPTKPITYNDIFEKPCLFPAYRIPNSSQFEYKNVGTICPPPTSCQTKFRIYNNISRKSFFNTPQTNFDASATIARYTDTYDPDGTLKLTQKVKFNIDNIKMAYESFAAKYGYTKEIYFALGAYTKADAINYSTMHPEYAWTKIVDKPCLIFAYHDDRGDKYYFKDIDGIICPPGN